MQALLEGKRIWMIRVLWGGWLPWADGWGLAVGRAGASYEERVSKGKRRNSAGQIENRLEDSMYVTETKVVEMVGFRYSRLGTRY